MALILYCPLLYCNWWLSSYTALIRLTAFISYCTLLTDGFPSILHFSHWWCHPVRHLPNLWLSPFTALIWPTAFILYCTSLTDGYILKCISPFKTFILHCTSTRWISSILHFSNWWLLLYWTPPTDGFHPILHFSNNGLHHTVQCTSLIYQFYPMLHLSKWWLSSFVAVLQVMAFTYNALLLSMALIYTAFILYCTNPMGAFHPILDCSLTDGFHPPILHFSNSRLSSYIALQ
jgi:hypothetical protein